MDIRAILEKLDPGNDDHWTNAGLPAVGAVSELAGENVTRQQIGEAYPGFDREKANNAKSADQGGEEPPAAPKQAGTDDGGAVSDEDAPQPDPVDGTFSTDDGLVTEGEAKSLDPYSEDPGHGLAVGKHDEDPDAIALIEEALAAAQGERYMSNYDLQGFVRDWQVRQTSIRANQRRIDARRAERLERQGK